MDPNRVRRSGYDWVAERAWTAPGARSRTRSLEGFEFLEPGGLAAEAAQEVAGMDGGEACGAQKGAGDLAAHGVDLRGVGGIGGGKELAFDLGAGGEPDLEPCTAETALQRGFRDPSGDQFHGAPFVPDEGVDPAAVGAGGIEFVEAVLAQDLGNLDHAESEVDEFGHEHAIGDLGEVAEDCRYRAAVGLEQDAGQQPEGVKHGFEMA